MNACRLGSPCCASCAKGETCEGETKQGLGWAHDDERPRRLGAGPSPEQTTFDASAEQLATRLSQLGGTPDDFALLQALKSYGDGAFAMASGQPAQQAPQGVSTKVAVGVGAGGILLGALAGYAFGRKAK